MMSQNDPGTIEKLQETVAKLKAENASLKEELNEKEKEITSKDQELLHLKEKWLLLQIFTTVDSFSSLYHAFESIAEKNAPEVIKLACKLGLSEKYDDTEKTILLNACILNNLKLVKILVENGCDRDAVDNQGANAFTIAALCGNTEILKYLVSANFDFHYKMGYNKANAIWAACSQNKLEAAQYLASIGLDINSADENGVTCAHAAALTCAVDTLKWLISMGCNLNAKTKTGFTALGLLKDNRMHPRNINYEPVIQILEEANAH